MPQGLIRLWRWFDQLVERAVLRHQTATEELGLSSLLVLIVVASFGLALVFPGASDQFLFVQLALVAFFRGPRAGLAWAFPTWACYAKLCMNWQEAAFFAGLCIYGILIAGVTTQKFRQARSHELQMQSSLELAREVQRSLQPAACVQCDPLEMASSIEHFGELGGDLVCWQRKADESGAYILVGDIMGKGVQAALTAAYVKGLFDEIARQCSGPRDLLQRLHLHLVRRTSVDSFLTAVCIEVDNAGTWVVCRAGFPNVFLSRASGEALAGADPGLMLGLPFEPQLEEARWPRQPGDQLIVTSDGLMEEEEAPRELLAHLQEVRCLEIESALKSCVGFLRRRGTASGSDDQTAVLLRW